MPLDDFITEIYCWVDDEVKKICQTPLRTRGFKKALSDAEVITMEIVGEFLKIDTDCGIWLYFNQHWKKLFPMLRSRSQFAKQSMALWAIKQCLLKTLNNPVLNEDYHIVDGFPLSVCHFRRAHHCHRFKGEASYGYCASKREPYYGFKGHLLVSLSGEITGFTLTEANQSEREAALELLDNKQGVLLGDKGYLGAEYKQQLHQQGIELITPVRANMKEIFPHQLITLCNRLRRRVETSIGQLTTRFNIEHTWAQGLLGLTNRLTRKLLSHSLSVFINRKKSDAPLQLANLLR